MSTAGNSSKVFADPSGWGGGVMDAEKQAQAGESASTEPAETCLLAAELTISSCRVRTIEFNTVLIMRQTVN